MKRALVILSVLMLFSVHAVAQVLPVPPGMNFQGRLSKPDGTPLADGTYSVRFSLWTASTGGTEKWNQTQNVTARHGVFALLLSNFPTDIFHGNLWLEIKVGSSAPLTPRQQLVSVAYAMKANSVPDGSIGAQQIANGSITADKFVVSALPWFLGGNAGTDPLTHFLGTTDNQPLEMRVNGRRAMRFSYAENASYRSINVLGGSQVNSIVPGVVGATIAGGGADIFTDSTYPNQVMADFGTVGGGFSNTAGGSLSTVTGGINNSAAGTASFVAGGYGNTANGTYASVAGGYFNTADGAFSFAAGRRAQANHDGTFVWCDNSNFNQPFTSTGVNQFLIHASGGVGINTNSPQGTLHVKGNYYGQGNLWLYAYEGDGNNGTAYVQARDNTTTSNLKLALRTKRGNSLIDALVLDPLGNGVLAGTLSQNSDARWKKEIASFENALETVLNLRGVTYRWSDASRGMERQIGFIAQEVEKVLPELVSTDSRGYKSVAYANVVPVLVEAMKAQQKQREADRAEMKALKAENTALQEKVKEIDILKAQVAALAERMAQNEAVKRERK